MLGQLMLKYRGTNRVRHGSIGLVLIVLVIAVGLQPERLTALATDIRYRAVFHQAGGLEPGNDVTMSGMTVGRVSAVHLSAGQAMVTFTVPSSVALGSDTTAHIRTGSLLGARILTIDPAGSDRLRAGSVIPVARTSSPYSLNEAVGDLTNDITGMDTDGLNQSLDALSTAIDAVAPELGATFDGLSRLSRALNGRNKTLGDLFRDVSEVSAILSDRSQEVQTLILNANDLLDVMVRVRQAIVDLLANSSAVAQQLSSLIHENRAELAPTLEKLNSVLAVLQKNRDNIAKALPGLAKYELTTGELVASGPYYQAMIANLAIPQMLQPFLDYAFGFRRGGTPGVPPERSEPRAEFPIPHNGIPIAPGPGGPP